MWYNTRKKGGLPVVELFKSIVKWIVIVLLFILLIFALVRLVNGNDAKKVNSATKTKIQTVTKKDNDEEEKEEVITSGKKETTISESSGEETKEEVVTTTTPEATEVTTPDTATSEGIGIIFGFIILGVGTYYIYKNRNITE